MFRTGPLSIIRSTDAVFTAIGICHASSIGSLLASFVGRLLARSLTSLADRQQN
jgi:hypothetical protein